jgi:putative lipoic acid-binding regulatory protein
MDSDLKRPIMEFPTFFRLRVFGLHADDFATFVMVLVRRHVPELNEDHIDTHPSHGGKYLAVKVSFVAESREQLDAIYQDLSGHERVLFVL